MKSTFKTLWLLALTATSMVACNPSTSEESAASDSDEFSTPGQSAVQDVESMKNVVQIAAGSKDHSTLVTAVKAAEYVDVLVNVGPFTVFAPVNAAFDKLPAGTVDNLLKPENKDALRNILEYHVSLGVYKTDAFQDGQVIGQANGDNITLTQKDGKWYVNGAAIVASVEASNGLVHVVDGVLLPPEKK